MNSLADGRSSGKDSSQAPAEFGSAALRLNAFHLVKEVLFYTKCPNYTKFLVSRMKSDNIKPNLCFYRH
jgi:hypothetical protein